jgi:hypothetical protein
MVNEKLLSATLGNVCSRYVKGVSRGARIAHLEFCLSPALSEQCSLTCGLRRSSWGQAVDNSAAVDRSRFLTSASHGAGGASGQRLAV